MQRLVLTSVPLYVFFNYLHHDYFMLYRVVDDKAIVDSIFHFFEDYENKMK